jgi:hypothetical protein
MAGLGKSKWGPGGANNDDDSEPSKSQPEPRPKASSHKSRSQGWNKNKEERGKKGASARGERLYDPRINEPVGILGNGIDHGYGRSSTTYTSHDNLHSSPSENTQHGIQRQSVAEEHNSPNVPLDNTPRLDTDTSRHAMHTGRGTTSSYATPAPTATPVQVSEEDVKTTTLLPSTTNPGVRPKRVAKRPSARIVRPVSSSSSSSSSALPPNTLAPTTNVLPAPSASPIPIPISQPTTTTSLPPPVIAGSTTKATTKDITFRIPPQSTLSDTDYFFLIAKLRGREISAEEWEDAVGKVRGLGFEGMATAVVAEGVGMDDQRKEGEGEELRGVGKGIRGGEKDKGKGKIESRLADDFRRLLGEDEDEEL